MYKFCSLAIGLFLVITNTFDLFSLNDNLLLSAQIEIFLNYILTLFLTSSLLLPFTSITALFMLFLYFSLCNESYWMFHILSLQKEHLGHFWLFMFLQ